MLLLVIVLAIPGGIAEILDFKNRRPLESGRAIVPRPELLGPLLGAAPDAGALTLEQVALSFGGVQAIDGLDLEIRPGQVHGNVGLQVATTDVPATDACPARKIPSVALFYAPNKDFVGKDSVQVELTLDAKILAASFLITVQEVDEK